MFFIERVEEELGAPGMPENPSIPPIQIHFAQGEIQNLGKAKNQTETLTKFIRRFEPVVTREKFHQYKAMGDQQQARVKNAGGWYMPAPTESGTRKKSAILPRDVITLDVDYATPEWQAKFLAGAFMQGIFLFGHTTRSHTPEKPRFRVIIPVTEPIHAEDYGRVCRIVAQKFDPDLEHVDKVSARIAQMMYYPTCSSDMEQHYVRYIQEGELLDWQAEVDAWEIVNGDSLDLSRLPRFAGEAELRESADLAEDPKTKDGPVGTFCRAYSISELIEGPLAEYYEITEWAEHGTPKRATYLLGTSSNGAVIYDDDFIYSHHGSDPAQEMLCNAWDLCRIHLHGGGEDDTDTPMSQRPSWKAMLAWAKDDRKYKDQLTEERFDLDHMFSDDEDMSWA